MAAEVELVGLMEIAVMFDVRPATPYRWREREILPEPDFIVSDRPIWLLPTIEAWAHLNQRKIVKRPPRTRQRRR
jgi:hypothetical protein